ncbi:MAG: restriction endonuclease subunit S [Thermoguttaceae bacterium]|nr:restriction endonuclease subunit S [Thermoguttaceae bacterium]
MSLKECCKSIVGGNTPSMNHPEYYGGNIPFIKSGDVKGRTVCCGTLSLTNTALEKTNAKLLPAGTVLVVIRSAALQHEFHAAVAEVPVVINQDIKGLQVKDEFLPEFIMWALISNEQRLLSGVRTVLTSHIETKDLLDLPIYRASKEAQTSFCDFVTQCAKSKFLLHLTLEAISIIEKPQEVISHAGNFH